MTQCTILDSSTKVEKKSSGAEKGAGYLTLIVFGLIISALVYSAFQIAPFFYYYYDLQNQMESMIRIASMEGDQEIRKRLLYYVHKYEIPASDDALMIRRDGNTMEISLKYTEVFYVSWEGKDYVIWKFPFHAHAKDKIATSR